MKIEMLSVRALVALGAMGVLALAGCSSAEPEPEPEPVTPTSSPTEAPAPIEEPPAPQLEWWEQAGPGWIMVQVQVGPDAENASPSDDHADPGFLTNDRLIAMSPDGQRYDYLALDTMEASYALAWMGTTVAVIRVEQSFMGLPEGPITVWDIATDDSDVVAAGVWGDDVVETNADGLPLISGFGGDSSTYSVLDAQWNRTELCGSLGTPTRLSISPDRSELACVGVEWPEGSDAGRATLGVSSTAAASAVDVKAELPGDYWDYQVGGWLSPTEVLLVRSPEGGSHSYVTVDTVSGQVVETELPVDGAEYAVFFDHAAGVFYSQRANSVAFYDRDGQVVAEVTCGVEFDRWDQRVTFSGHRAVVDCASLEEERAPLDLMWVNLESGETASILGDIPGGSTRVVLPWLEGRAEG